MKKIHFYCINMEKVCFDVISLSLYIYYISHLVNLIKHQEKPTVSIIRKHDVLYLTC